MKKPLIILTVLTLLTAFTACTPVVTITGGNLSSRSYSDNPVESSVEAAVEILPLDQAFINSFDIKDPKSAIERYCNLKSLVSLYPKGILPELKLITAEKMYELYTSTEGEAFPDGYIYRKTGVAYSHYESVMLHIVSPDVFTNIFMKNFKNDEGMLVVHGTFESAFQYEVVKIDSLGGSDGKFKYQVSLEYGHKNADSTWREEKKGTAEAIFELQEYPSYYVITNEEQTA